MLLTLNTVYKLLHEKDSLRFTLVVNVEINAIKVATRADLCFWIQSLSRYTVLPSNVNVTAEQYTENRRLMNLFGELIQKIRVTDMNQNPHHYLTLTGARSTMGVHGRLPWTRSALLFRRVSHSSSSSSQGATLLGGWMERARLVRAEPVRPSICLRSSNNHRQS